MIEETPLTPEQAATVAKLEGHPDRAAVLRRFYTEPHWHLGDGL